MSKGKIIGILLLVAAVAVAIVFGMKGGGDGPGLLPSDKELITVAIRYGSEKKGLLHDEEVLNILRQKYGIELDLTKMGSLEMSDPIHPLDNVDGLWPSSELAMDVFADRHAGVTYKKQIIFRSPIVFYSWMPVVEALVNEGVVEQRDGIYYFIDTKRFFTDYIVAGKQWKDIGLTNYYGSVNVRFTDPKQSNSGFLMTGLTAVMLNEGMVDPNTVRPHLDAIQAIYTNMGKMQHSSGVLFEDYKSNGEGANPLIANYESMIIENYINVPEGWDPAQYQSWIKDNLIVVIPTPTVWSGHPFIALTDGGERLMEALQDPDIQRIAWERFGFRTSFLAPNNELLKTLRLPDTITSVTPLPGFETMKIILDSITYQSFKAQ